MSPRVDWKAYRRGRLEQTLIRMQPLLRAIEQEIFEDIEIAEVSEVFQRFKDFQLQLEQIQERHLR